MEIRSEIQQQNLISEQDFEIAKRHLEQIKDYFEDAEHLSEKFKSRTIERTKQSEDLVTFDQQFDLDPEYRRLHLTMRELAIKRQSGSTYAKKQLRHYLRSKDSTH